MGTATEHPVPDRQHLQFLTSGHSDAQLLASECPDVKNSDSTAIKYPVPDPSKFL